MFIKPALSFLLPVLIFLTTETALGQTPQSLPLNKEVRGIKLTRSIQLQYALKLSKGGIYQITVLQEGIAVAFELTDPNNNQLLRSSNPEDITGYLKSEFSPAESTNYFLKIERFDHPENTDSGEFTVYIKSLSKKEIATRKKIREELAPENSKHVQTLDIDHFWEAFDQLKNCRSFKDSVSAIQSIYLDRATNGLIDFIRVREFTAEKFVQVIGKYPKFYSSVRQNTYEVKKSEPAIEAIFMRFKEIYPNFRPFKVCFAIGVANTGGTVSDQFVLIGAEISTSSHGVDNSEFIQNGEQTKAELLAGQEDLQQKIKNMVAHECVHTQQKNATDSAARNCKLLHKVLLEGSCDFIGKMVAGDLSNTVTQEYGDAHEEAIWLDLKKELCSDHLENWVYNASRVKDKPADLGYYVGYKIAQSYYEQAADKQQAIIDIIEMTNPVRFLALSKYEEKQKL